MSSPIEQVTVQCPECQAQYQDWYRASMNLDLDDFDDDYVDAASRAVCPNCGHIVYFDSMIVRDHVFHVRSEDTVDDA